MANASRIVRDGAVQKSFWLRGGLDARLVRVIKERRRADQKFSERRALALAIRAFVEKEEQALGLAGVSTPDELVEQIAEAAAQLRVHVGARRA